MRESNKFLSCLVAAGIALAPLPAVARSGESFSRENFSVGLELNVLDKGLGGTTAMSGTARVPFFDTFTAQADNTVENVKLTEVLARVNYQFNGHFTPYLLLGVSGLSFDDGYKLNVGSLLSIDTTVPYSDSLALGYGFGAEGVLLELPARMKLTYGMRMFTFSSSDSEAVPPEQISSVLARLNPIEKASFTTDVTFREWDFSLGVSREYDLDGDFSVIPALGYRHCSVTMDAATEVEYSPGMPYYMKGTVERSLGASLSSATLAVTGRYKKLVGATIMVALGDETGFSLAVNYGF